MDVEQANEAPAILGYNRMACVGVVGLNGSLLVLRNGVNVFVDVLFSINQELHLHIQINSLAFSFYLSAIYASPRLAERHFMWDNLIKMSESISGPWVLLRYFNDNE